jgi:hypothetical protein
MNAEPTPENPNPHSHDYEELEDGSADCFECGHKLSRGDWAKRRRERDSQEQVSLEVAGAQSCPR